MWLSLQAAFNLLVCSYALGDKQGMMTAFQKLLMAPGLAAQRHDDDEGPETEDDSSPEGATDEALLGGMSAARGRWAMGDGGSTSDKLKQEQRQQQASSSRYRRA